MENRLLVVSVLLCAFVIGSYGDGEFGQDGCSTGSNLPYRSDFRPACNMHDVCYACGAVFGLSRYDCDRRFYNDMNEICRRHEHWCRMWRDLYYGFVRMFSSSSYNGNKYRNCHLARERGYLK